MSDTKNEKKENSQPPVKEDCPSSLENSDKALVSESSSEDVHTVTCSTENPVKDDDSTPIHHPQPSCSPRNKSPTPPPNGRSPSPHTGRGSRIESRFIPEHMDGVAQFIVKLYELVCDSSTENLITWSEDHNKEAFVVYDPSEFAATVLPNYFKHSNFCSFVRQLNIYGFRKIESKKGFVFQQENFRYNAPELLKNIQRRKQAHKRTSPPPAAYYPPQRMMPNVMNMNTLYDVPNTTVLPMSPNTGLSSGLSMLAACAAASTENEATQQRLTSAVTTATPTAATVFPMTEILTAMRSQMIIMQKQIAELQTECQHLRDIIMHVQKTEPIAATHIIPMQSLDPMTLASLQQLGMVKAEGAQPRPL